jgi:hypothetical protein
VRRRRRRRREKEREGFLYNKDLFIEKAAKRS